ncbi:DNA-binding protein [Campylobacter concisus]|uniref:DNA-binding protein n=1 Tax=Campylobacter concisus TaxID=199 RepID=UPI000B3D640B|nr:DNA-binding protein [Campylobacter concisus]OUT13793.1 DNA-binding protein [Campylobacter concisus]
MLKDKIINNESGIVLYGLTPPKAEFDEAKLKEIAAKWDKRITDVQADGLVLYEIQDESSRIKSERTFEFSDTLSPEIYYSKYLNLKTPSIFYRVANKYDESEFRANLAKSSSDINVFVGVASGKVEPKMSLERAYEIARDEFKELVVGGVCIAERHAKKGDEEQRMSQKAKMGAKFFISQAVFDINLAKNLLTSVAKSGLNLPIILTFTTCGTPKTLDFIKWLGISVDEKSEKRMLQSDDFLATASQICLENFAELYEFAKKLGINVGVNIESVMAKRAEIEASLELTHKMREVF